MSKQSVEANQVKHQYQKTQETKSQNKTKQSPKTKQNQTKTKNNQEKMGDNLAPRFAESHEFHY